MKAFSSPPASGAEENGKNAASKQALLKKWSRLFRDWRHRAAAARLKRQILRLEKARLKEKTEMISKRRFYERLFRRNITALMDDVSKAAKSVDKKEVPAPAPLVAPLRAPARPIVPPVPAPAPEAMAAPAPSSSVSVEEFARREEERFAADLARTKELKAVEAPVSAPVIETRQASAVPTPASVPTPTPTPAIAPLSPKPVREKAHKKFFSGLFNSSLAQKLAKEREEEKAWQERNDVEKRFWQAYTGVKPNLIKNQATVFFNWYEHFLVLILAIVISCLILSLVYVGLLVWQKERLQISQSTIVNTEALEADIKKHEQDIKEIIAFNDKLGEVASLLDNHVYWTSLLTFLENSTLRDVYYENFTGDLSGEYLIPSASRSLEAVSLQLEVMKADKLVKAANYDLKPTGDTTGKVLFNLGLSLDPQIFLK